VHVRNIYIMKQFLPFSIRKAYVHVCCVQHNPIHEYMGDFIYARNEISSGDTSKGMILRQQCFNRISNLKTPVCHQSLVIVLLCGIVLCVFRVWCMN
jgi:hypothetical protein